MFECPVCGYVTIIQYLGMGHKTKYKHWAQGLQLLWPATCEVCGNFGLRLTGQLHADEEHRDEHAAIQKRFLTRTRQPRIMCDWDNNKREWIPNTDKITRLKGLTKARLAR